MRAAPHQSVSKSFLTFQSRLDAAVSNRSPHAAHNDTRHCGLDCSLLRGHRSCTDEAGRVRIKLGHSPPLRGDLSCTGLKRVANSEVRGNVVVPLSTRDAVLAVSTV